MKIIREYLLENWGLKLTAILVASILWLLVRGESAAERIINIPLELRLPRNMEIINERPSTIEVTVRGATGTALFIQPVISGLIDLQDEPEGLHVVQLTEKNVRISRTSGLEIVAIRPARISLVLERTISKDVPVRLVRGEPAAGLDVYSISITPSVMRITGPRSHINLVQEVITEPISLSGRTESFSIYANLDIKDPLIHSSPPEPVEVRVELGLHRRLHSIGPIPVALDSAAWVARPRFVSAYVLVPVNRPGGLTPADFIATLFVNNLEASLQTARLRPVVKLKSKNDPSISIKEIRPAEISVYRVRKP